MRKTTKKLGRPPIQEVTDKQHATLETIKRLIKKFGFAPTVSEIAADMTVTPASAHEQLTQLVRKGAITMEPRKSRSIRVVESVSPSVQELVSIPIIGTVAAGQPILAEERITGHVSVAATLAGRGKCFALRVSGKSMVDAKIFDGDLVIVRQQAMADSGEIVVAMIDGEATVKRLRRDDDLIELIPENRTMRPIVVDHDSDFRILGKVVGVTRPAAM